MTCWKFPILDPDTVDLAHTRALLERAKLKAAGSLGLSADADVIQH